MGKVKLVKYQLYKVRFFDHCVNIDKEMVIEAVGFFIKSTRNAYVFSHWLVQSKDKEIVRNNLEPFTLIKKAIISISPLSSRLGA